MGDTEQECKLTDKWGIIAQIGLAGLIVVVLLTEWLLECLKSLCVSHYVRRSFRTFWFDSYKICAGELLAHVFNIAVSIVITRIHHDANQCVIYGLTFYYINSGVPFVYLLHYLVIQYARKMAYPSQQNARFIDKNCRQRWQWIFRPGIYPPRTVYNTICDCIHCKDCRHPETRCKYFKITLLVLVAIAFNVVGLGATYILYKSSLFVNLSVGFFGLLFVVSTVFAPVSALWQTFEWIIVKLIEKTLWSGFAISQAYKFGQWGHTIGSTGSTYVDTGVSLIGVPFVVNIFVYFMYSRICRLKLPKYCLRPKYSDTIDRERAKMESFSASNSAYKESMLEETSDEEIYTKLDKKEAFKVGIVFMVILNGILAVAAITYLCYWNAMQSIWILFLSMIVVPAICALVTISIFGYVVDKDIHVCCCCVNKNNLGDDNHDITLGVIQEDSAGQDVYRPPKVLTFEQSDDVEFSVSETGGRRI
eukprot:27110_1